MSLPNIKLVTCTKCGMRTGAKDGVIYPHGSSKDSFNCSQGEKGIEEFRTVKKD